MIIFRYMRQFGKFKHSSFWQVLHWRTSKKSINIVKLESELKHASGLFLRIGSVASAPVWFGFVLASFARWPAHSWWIYSLLVSLIRWIVLALILIGVLAASGALISHLLPVTLDHNQLFPPLLLVAVFCSSWIYSSTFRKWTSFHLWVSAIK